MKHRCPDPSLLGTIPLRELAARWGVTVHRVRRMEIEAGIIRGLAGRVGRRPLTCPDPSILYLHEAKDLAAKWGVSVATVQTWRRDVPDEQLLPLGLHRNANGMVAKLCPDPSILFMLPVHVLSEKWGVSHGRVHTWRQDYRERVLGRDGTEATRGHKPRPIEIPDDADVPEGSVRLVQGQTWETADGTMGVVPELPECRPGGIIVFSPSGETAGSNIPVTGWADQPGCVIANRHGVVLRANGCKLVFGENAPWPTP